MTVFTEFKFDGADGYAQDSAPVGGDHLGIYLHGAAAVGGSAVPDGEADLARIFPDPADQSALGLRVRLGEGTSKQTQTVLARDAEGAGASDLKVEGLARDATLNGAEAGAGATGWQTASSFAGPGAPLSDGFGGSDHDSLRLTGSGFRRLADGPTHSDGNGFDGRGAHLDAHGHATGETNFCNIEEIVPCFTPGTLIATPRGEVAVEDLRVGDRVITRDDGLQQIRWVGRKDMDWSELRANAHLKPVLVTAGSLGDGLPERDMMVSPNHRMLVSNDRTSIYFDEHEVLVAAKHLLSGKRIAPVDAAGLTYIHFMFDRHQVVLANGAWSESFQPGDYSLKGIGNSQRQELFELFPELKTAQGVQGYSAARRVLRRHEAVLLGH